MQFFNLDLSSKRAKLALRFFTYGVMTISTVALTVVLVLVAMGYQFDRDELSFEQGGLIQLRSFPEGASVVVDGKNENAVATPGRVTLPVGQHSFEMKLAGYKTWTKKVNLAAGQLLWLNYARFVPDSITTTPLRNLENLAAIEPSPNQQWLAILPDGKQPNLVIVDVRDPEKPQFIDIPVAQDRLTKKDNAIGTFQLVEWDLSSRYILLRHEMPDGQYEFVRLDRTRPTELENITQDFKLNITDAHFAGNNANVVYVKTDDVLRRLDMGNNTASAALVSGLRTFLMYGGNTLAFSADREQTPGDAASKRQVIGVLKDNKETIVRDLPLETKAQFDYAEYFNHGYMALSVEKSIQVIRDPLDPGDKKNRTFAQFEMASVPQWLNFSNNGRMLAAQFQNTIGTYDLEEGRSYHMALDQPTTGQPARWLDDFYLWSDATGNLQIFEFDGQNKRTITGVSPGFRTSLSSNGEYMFSIGPNSVTKQPVLQRSTMVIQK